jgi:hypothetical protein
MSNSRLLPSVSIARTRRRRYDLRGSGIMSETQAQPVLLFAFLSAFLIT